MADFCDDLENWFRSRTRITDLVGEGAACRVFPDALKQGCSLPAIHYNEAGGDSIEHLGGGAGFARTVLHVYSYGATRRAANQLAEIVKEEMRPYRGMMGSRFVSGVNCSSHRDTGIDQPQDNSDAKRYWTRRIYDVWHTETT